MEYLAILIASFGGGAVRGMVGFVKHQYSYSKVEFSILYFSAMTFISGMIGLLIVASISQTELEFLGGTFTPAIAFIIAYAGGDFIESIYKIIVKKPNL
jgi:hypothetical protein